MASMAPEETVNAMSSQSRTRRGRPSGRCSLPMTPFDMMIPLHGMGVLGALCDLHYLLHRVAKSLGALVQGSPFFVGHRRFEDAADPFPADDARQRQSDVVVGVVRADRPHRPLVAQYRFGDPGGHDPDAELARLIAFDDGDVGIADVALDALAEIVHRVPSWQSLGDRHAAHSGRRPQHDLRSAVLADYLGLDRCGVDPEPLSQVNPEAQAVEQRAGAEHSVVSGEPARQVGERIGRVADDEKHRPRRRLDDLWDQVLVYADVGVEQLEASLGVVAVCGAAALLIYPG